MTTSSAFEEKKDITLAKGLGIFLVVVGHILARGTSEGNQWFTELTHIIYLFHMPFFMALSGYVYFRPGRVKKIWHHYGDFMVKQIVRLLLPFFLLGLIVLAGKMIAAQVLHVDNKPQDIIVGVSGLFCMTENSPSTFIWYIYVLFIYAAIMPVIYHFVPKPLWVCLVVGGLLYLLPPIHYIYMDKLFAFFLFFIIGGIMRCDDKKYLDLIDRYIWLFVFLFIASFSLYALNLFPYKYTKLIIGLLSIPALHAACRVLLVYGGKGGQVLYLLGSYTLVIYLFNTISIGVVKGVMFKFANWDGLNFLFFAPILILSGVLGPIIISKLWDYLWLLGQRVFLFIQKRQN
ncbi:MAG: acyltransferase family protein [Candidatus Kuenenia stuttgartiensis]|nr:acyltransferase family protein [Candidatus Kuenenia stuttgartiensis]GJQ50837.1 MAG: hypothetical protein HKUEN01_32230 [Candidatus Kuenenia stuttgartiensis]